MPHEYKCMPPPFAPASATGGLDGVLASALALLAFARTNQVTLSHVLPYNKLSAVQISLILPTHVTHAFGHSQSYNFKILALCIWNNENSAGQQLLNVSVARAT